MGQHDPADCHVCGARASGIGMGYTDRTDREPRWLCHECALILEQIRSAKRPDAYEVKAREGGMEAGGEFVEKYGSDLGEWTEAQVLEFVGAVWQGCRKRIRKLIVEDGAPF